MEDLYTLNSPPVVSFNQALQKTLQTLRGDRVLFLSLDGLGCRVLFFSRCPAR